MDTLSLLIGIILGLSVMGVITAVVVHVSRRFRENAEEVRSLALSIEGVTI